MLVIDREMIKLTEAESKRFIVWYKQRYGDIQELPKIKAHEEEAHKELWMSKLRNILGNKSDKVYKYRSWGKETVLEKVFDSLRLNYGPIIEEVTSPQSL